MATDEEYIHHLKESIEREQTEASLFNKALALLPTNKSASNIDDPRTQQAISDLTEVARDRLQRLFEDEPASTLPQALQKLSIGAKARQRLLEENLADFERDRTDPRLKLNVGNLAAIFGMSQAAVRRLIEEGRLKPEGKEIIYRIRQSEIDRYKAELTYRSGKRFIIVEGEISATTPKITFSDEIAAHVKGKIVGEGFVAYELDRVLTPEENIFFIQQGIRLLSGAGFHDYRTKHEREERERRAVIRYVIWDRVHDPKLQSTPLIYLRICKQAYKTRFKMMISMYSSLIDLSPLMRFSYFRII